MLRCWVEWVRQAFISHLKNLDCCSTYPIHPHFPYYPILHQCCLLPLSHCCCLLPPMPQDILPPIKLVEGPHKHILTKKAREAAEVPLKHTKLQPAAVKMSVLTVSNPSAASIKLLSLTMAIPVSVPSSVESIPKRIAVCPSDYTNNNYD